MVKVKVNVKIYVVKKKCSYIKCFTVKRLYIFSYIFMFLESKGFDVEKQKNPYVPAGNTLTIYFVFV